MVRGEERQMKEEWRGRSRGLGSGRGGWGKKNEEKGGRGVGKKDGGKREE